MEWKGGKDGGGSGTTRRVAATTAIATIFTRRGNDDGNGGGLRKVLRCAARKTTLFRVQRLRISPLTRQAFELTSISSHIEYISMYVLSYPCLPACQHREYTVWYYLVMVVPARPCACCSCFSCVDVIARPLGLS